MLPTTRFYHTSHGAIRLTSSWPVFRKRWKFRRGSFFAAISCDIGRPILTVKSIGETRWNSEYDALERLLAIRVPLNVVLQRQGVDTLTDVQWKEAAAVLELLQPLRATCVALEGHLYPTLSLLVPGLRLCFRVLATWYEANKHSPELGSVVKFCSSLRFALAERCPDYLPETLLSFALDPRFKSLKIFWQVHLHQDKTQDWTCPDRHGSS